MENLILLALLGLILGGAAGYVYKAKKKGVKCIGCPDGSTCSGSCSGCCGCNHEEKKKHRFRGALLYYPCQLIRWG